METLETPSRIKNTAIVIDIKPLEIEGDLFMTKQ